MAYYLIFHIKFLDSVSFLEKMCTSDFYTVYCSCIVECNSLQKNNNEVHIIVSRCFV